MKTFKEILEAKKFNPSNKNIEQWTDDYINMGLKEFEKQLEKDGYHPRDIGKIIAYAKENE